MKKSPRAVACPDVSTDHAALRLLGDPARDTAAAGETASAEIEAIHRHSSGVITFHQNVDGKFENLLGVRSEHLRRMWPEFVAKLKSDVFMSLNAYFDCESQPHYLSAVRCRNPDRLRYLCPCFADLDCYKLSLRQNAPVDYMDGGRGPGVNDAD